MRISDWSSDVCSSDLQRVPAKVTIETISRIRSGVPMKLGSLKEGGRDGTLVVVSRDLSQAVRATGIASTLQQALEDWSNIAPRLVALSDALNDGTADGAFDLDVRSEEHTSELQSLMRISYAVFC